MSREPTPGGAPPRRATPDDPRLLPFLPALYLAWADGELDAEEVTAIRGRLDDATGLGERCRALLGTWLDPDDPPGGEELDALLAIVRRAVAGRDRSEIASLVDLADGLAAARGEALSEAELDALTALAGALGVSGAAVAPDLLGRPRPAPPAATAPSDVAVAELRALLDEPRSEVRDRVRALLVDPAFRIPVEIPRAEHRERALAACRRLADEGLGRLAFPPEAGGAGDPEAFVAAFETLAFGDLSILVKFGVQFGLWGGSVAQLGTERHHRDLLPSVASLDLPGSFAMTETGHGSNVAELGTTATYDPATDELVVETPDRAAWKDYIGNAARDARMATVFAQLVVGGESQGVHALVVPLRDADGRALPGGSIEDCGPKLGLNGVDNGRLAFAGVRVPRTNLLDRFASIEEGGRYRSAIASPSKRFFTMLGTLVGGRVSVGAAAVTATKSALTLAIRYGERRRQFGPGDAPERTLLDHLAHRRRLLPPLATTYALHFALRDLAALYAANDPEGRRELEGRAAALKALATDHATETIQQCREACGGQGYLAVNRFAALKADTDVFTTFEGDNTVLLQLVAKHLLSGYARQFGRLDARGLVRLVVDRVETAVTELNPLAVRRTEEAHLRDREFQLDAVRWRERRLVATLARRLKSRLDDGMDPFDALGDCQDHAIDAARAHGERLVLESFAAAVDAAPEALAPTLAPLLDLHALSRIARDRGWFLEQGYLAPEKAKAIRDLVNRLCAEVRPAARGLVDAFGIPEPLLEGTIAADGGD